MLRMILALAIMMWSGASFAADPMPHLTGITAIHDPSVIVTDTGWASFATGVEGASDGGMPRTKTSPDGIDWQETGAIPGGLPAWIATELGYKPKNIWAPSISTEGGVAYLYYSASSFGRNDSAIGLMTNPTFDTSKPSEGWTDQGLVLRSHAGDNFNAIDPFRINSAGKAYLAFGSFWDGIRLVALDPKTGKRSNDSPPVRIASRGGGAIEAPALLEHEGKFYLFVSFDACCRGTSSTYNIRVGRSDQVEGPYLDRDGKALTDGGGTLLLAGQSPYRGPGGQEVFMVAAKPWLAFHYYDDRQGGAPRLQVAPLGWSADGWPELGPLPAP
ncbi:arabinan endo-1,5-alpha-L-arabinosidase [Devosia sp.]|uniref:arabinan endo-1,5-alpha-L-arabinosidase n=1 Tax=Devosia sp. TaxID=1871048 RepID=UPI003BAC5759